MDQLNDNQINPEKISEHIQLDDDIDNVQFNSIKKLSRFVFDEISIN